MPADDPLFSFGLLADVQYADDDTDPALDRHFRASLGKLEEAIAEFNRHELAFVVHLGDLVDHDLHNLPPVRRLLAGSQAPVRHVLGNHDFTARSSPTGLSDLDEVCGAFGLPTPYYSFDLPGWRFLVLNTNEVGTIAHPPDSAGWQQGRKLLDRLAAEGRPNAQVWNGTIGGEQRDWLAEQLRGAERAGRRAIVLAHHPVHPDHGDNLLDDLELRDWLAGFPAMTAWFNGHQHFGGYGHDRGIHFLTFCGVVQSAQNAYAIARVHQDRIEVAGYHREPSRSLIFAGRPSMITSDDRSDGAAEPDNRKLN